MNELDFLFKFIRPEFPTTSQGLNRENELIADEFVDFYKDVVFGSDYNLSLHVAIFYRLKFILLYWVPYNRCVIELKKKSDKFDSAEIEADVKFLDDLSNNINKLLLKTEHTTFNRLNENDIPALFKDVDSGDVVIGRKQCLVSFLRYVGLGTISLKKPNTNSFENFNYIPMKSFVDDKMKYFSKYPEITDTDFGKYALKYPIPSSFILRLKNKDILEDVADILSQSKELRNDLVKASSIVKKPDQPSDTLKITGDSEQLSDSGTDQSDISYQGDDIIVPVMGEEVENLEIAWGQLDDKIKEKKENQRLKMMVEKFIIEKEHVVKEIEEAEKKGIEYDKMNRTIENPYKLENEVLTLFVNS